MPRIKLITFVASLFLAFNLYAEESVTEQAERLASQPTGEAADLGIVTRRAKLTEEQAVNQLKYMTVQGWKRIEQELQETGEFTPFGLTLSPQGEFKAVHIDSGETEVPTDVKIDALVRNLKAIADTRSVWSVGMMYIAGERRADGTPSLRIAVVAEHIAGWARAWSYPYRITDEGIRIGNAKELEMDPVYYTRQ